VKDILRATRRHYSTEDKIRIVPSGLRGEDSIAELCRKEGIAQCLYYSWSKEFLEAGKRRLAEDTALAAASDEVLSMRSQTEKIEGGGALIVRGLVEVDKRCFHICFHTPADNV